MSEIGFVILDGTVIVDGTDLSDHVREVQVNLVAADVDATGLNGGGGSTHRQGLKNENFMVTFMSDYNPGSVDAVLFPHYDAGTEFTVQVQPFAGAASDTNPRYEGTCILVGTYAPISGQVGALSTTQVTFPVQGRIARYTT